ncbi:hypothetical protein HanRHA438_Chr15g0693081 [Helianthus annuus]|nr:hypothetical protein HanRHA438_Chr15g0693081 [Helianthus annuus]
MSNQEQKRVKCHFCSYGLGHFTSLVQRFIFCLGSKKVDLKFKAKFWFSMGSIYKAPPLLVETLLTSEESKGSLRSGSGRRLDEEGRCKLVGVATVEPIDDFFMNSFLDLPTECLAILNATITFSKDEDFKLNL